MAEQKKVAIDWFNIKTGEKVYTRRPAQIKAFIESSNLGVNRKSDRGWRIGKVWYNKLRKARANRQFMEKLYERYGEDVSDANVMVAIFQQEVRALVQRKRYEDDAPFEEEYLQSLRSAPANTPRPKQPQQPEKDDKEKK